MAFSGNNNPFHFDNPNIVGANFSSNSSRRTMVTEEEKSNVSRVENYEAEFDRLNEEV
jgi:hypothetical protein